MKIDKVRHRELSATKLIQPIVSKLVKIGLGKEQIEKKLEWVRGKAVDGDREYDLTLPRIVLEPSHLGKGLLAFFICPPCQRKVRAVYMLDSRMACRVCHGLTYKKQDRRKGIINRLIWDDNLRNKYLNYEWGRKYRLAMEAKLARETIIERGYKLGQEMIEKLRA